MDEFSVAMVAFAIGFLVGGVVAVSLTTSEFERDTIQRGLAQYCPTDGAWAWKGECK